MAKGQGSPQLENGWTPIANELLEQLARINLSPYEGRVLWAIIRKTYGWHKKMDYISNSQLVDATGIKKFHVSRAIKSLVQRDIVTWIGNTRVKKYGLQKDYTRWAKRHLLPKEVTDQLLPKEVTLLPKEVTISAFLLPKQVDTKEIYKETIQKKRRKQVAREKDPRIKEILDAISKKVGYQIPHYPKEGTAVKRALKMGFSLEQFIACWEKMKTFAFWKGKWLPLAKVTENLGEFVGGRLSDGSTGRDQRTPPSRRAPASAEDLAKGW